VGELKGWADPGADPMQDIRDWMELLERHSRSPRRNAIYRSSQHNLDRWAAALQPYGFTPQEALDSMARQYGFTGCTIEVVG
jgi:hypothetical protein